MVGPEQARDLGFYYTISLVIVVCYTFTCEGHMHIVRENTTVQTSICYSANSPEASLPPDLSEESAQAHGDGGDLTETGDWTEEILPSNPSPRMESRLHPTSTELLPDLLSFTPLVDPTFTWGLASSMAHLT